MGVHYKSEPLADIGYNSVRGESRDLESLAKGSGLVKKLTIIIIVVLLLAVTAVPAFAHPDASDDGLTTGVGEAGENPTGGNAAGRGEAQGNIVAHNPLCRGHGSPGSH